MVATGLEFDRQQRLKRQREIEAQNAGRVTGSPFARSEYVPEMGPGEFNAETQRRGDATGSEEIVMPPPVRMRPEVVEDTRLPMEPTPEEMEVLNFKPPRPMIEGTFMRSGQQETLGTLSRERPMSVEEARAAGLLAGPGPGFEVNIVGRNPGGVNAGMGHSLDAANRANMDATREARWGQSGPTRGAKFASVEPEYDRHGMRVGTVRTPLAGGPTGTQDRAQMILDTIRGREQMKAQTSEEIRKAQGTPQASTGYGGTAVYTPGANGRAGSWSQAERQTGGAKPMTPAQAASLIKQAAGLRAGDKWKGVAPDAETADAIENLLREQGFDVETLRGGTGRKDEGGRMKAEGNGGDANTRVIRGVTYKLVNGVWKKQA